MDAESLKSHARKRLVVVTLALALTAAFAWKTQVVWGGFYSKDANYRYQTDAFLRGELALRDSLLKHKHDWAWSDGAHQIWGLGIPLLRLPFELVARLFGGEFPDRLVFLAIYALAAVALLTAPLLERKPGRQPRWQAVEPLNLATTLLLLFNPRLVALVGGNRFAVYEEAVATALIWAVLVYALVFHAIRKPGRAWQGLAAVAAGFAIAIRPTSVLFGVLAIASLAWFRLRARKRVWWKGVAALFLVTPAWVALTNFLRFGSPLSFGHEISLADRAEIFFSLRWGHSFQFHPFFQVAREFLGGMWTDDLYRAWVMRVPRFRELNFPHFFGDTLPVAALAWVVCVGLLAGARRQVRAAIVPLSMAVAWSAVTFTVFFLFYMRFNGLTARYYCEFIVPVFLAFTGVLAAMEVLLVADKRGWLRVVTYGAVCLAMLVSGLRLPLQGQAPRNSAGAPELAERALFHQRQPDLPDSWSCPSVLRPEDEVPYNGFGWRMVASCGVSGATMLFMNDVECLELVYELENSDRPPPVRVRVQREDLSLVRRAVAGRVVTDEFCGKGRTSSMAHRRSPVDFVVIGWVSPERVFEETEPPILLRKVRKSK